MKRCIVLVACFLLLVSETLVCAEVPSAVFKLKLKTENNEYIKRAEVRAYFTNCDDAIETVETDEQGVAVFSKLKANGLYYFVANLKVLKDNLCMPATIMGNKSYASFWLIPPKLMLDSPVTTATAILKYDDYIDIVDVDNNTLELYIVQKKIGFYAPLKSGTEKSVRLYLPLHYSYVFYDMEFAKLLGLDYFYATRGLVLTIY